MGEFSLYDGETEVKRESKFFAVVKDFLSRVAYTLSIPFQNLRHTSIKADSRYDTNKIPKEKPRGYITR